VFSACRCDGRRKQRGSAVLVTIAQQPGRAQITDIKRQDPSPPPAARQPDARRPDIGRISAGRTPAGRTEFGLPLRFVH